MSKEAAAEHAIIGATAMADTGKAFQRTTHPDAQWYPAAGLGLFFHWGISSVFGNTDLSWGMMEDWVWDEPIPGYAKVTPRQYYAEGMRKFNPEHYDPEPWLKAAAEAGVRYAVLTTKHHDGYALWPSEYGEIGVKYALGGRDLVAPFVFACRRYGIKVGLYYSPPDWYFNRDYMTFNTGRRPDGSRILKSIDLQPLDALPEMPKEHLEAYSAHIRGQVRELLTRYGKIDLLWFDGRGVPEDAPDPITIEEVRSLQPGIVVNPRMYGVGDFSTPECQIPETAPAGWWEVCHLLNDHGWGYTVHPYKSFDWLVDTFTKVRALGGNFLPNVAPMPDGRMPAEYFTRMKQLADWMKDHRQDVFM